MLQIKGEIKFWCWCSLLWCEIWFGEGFCHNAAFNHSHSHTSDAIVAPYCTIAPILFVILHVSINYQLYVDGCIKVGVVGRVGRSVSWMYKADAVCGKWFQLSG